jgi:uncharacterized delta-60 repeat protein
MPVGSSAGHVPGAIGNGRRFALVCLVWAIPFSNAAHAAVLSDEGPPRAFGHWSGIAKVADVYSEVGDPGRSLVEAGSLDTTFGNAGRVVTQFTHGLDFASAIAIQSDGKLVVAGRAGRGRFALARYHPDGTLDTTFSGDGKVATNLTPHDDWVADVAIQGDGKIVAAGFGGTCCSGPGGDGRLALARYNPDGSLDPTFGGDGRVVTNVTDGNDFIVGLAVQADGKVVAAGRAGGAGGRFLLARYRADGTLDSSFRGDGIVTVNFTAANEFAASLAAGTDGKIVAAGPGGGTFGLVRFRPNGVLDPSFSGDGKARTNFTAGPDIAWAVTIQPDGKTIAAGSARASGNTFALARYNANGTLDTSFSRDGKITTNLTRFDDYVSKVLLQADGKVVAVGSGNAAFALARYHTDGRLDASFSRNGRVLTRVTPEGDFAFGAAIQTDGRIVAVGRGGYENAAFALARYLAD